MLLVILEKDRNSFVKGPFKLEEPYVKRVDEALKVASVELKETTTYSSRHNMKVIRNKTVATFTFVNGIGRKNY